MTRYDGAYIGGLMGSAQQAERVGESFRLTRSLRDIEVVTFERAMKDPGRTADIIDGRVVATNSSGVAAAEEAMKTGVRPAELILVAGCMPTPLSKLFTTALLTKSPRMLWREGGAATKQFHQEVLQESPNVVGNLRHLNLIKRYHTLRFGVDAARSGVPTTAVFMEYDEFGFGQDVDDWVDHARTWGVNVCYVENAHHDDQLHRPREVHEYVLEQIGARAVAA